MIWALGLAVLLVALCTPLLATVRHSPGGRGRARHPKREPVDHLTELRAWVQALEDDLGDLALAVRELREDTQFLHGMLQEPARPPPLVPPTS